MSSQIIVFLLRGFETIGMLSILVKLAEIFFSLGSLIVSTITLCIGYKAYKKFLVRKAEERQLQLILDLLHEIHQNGISYSIHYPDERSEKVIITTIYNYNIFELVKDANFLKEKKIYFIDDNRYPIPWGFYKKFYANPILPQSIARVLKKFNAAHIDRISYVSLEGESFIAVHNPTVDVFVHQTQLYQMQYLPSTIDFKRHTEELRHEILVWLSNYGIKDVNIIAE